MIAETCVQTNHVLVVDDAPDIRLLARLLLERGGYQVTEAPTAEAALEMLADFRPEVILLDLQLPGMDGWALLRDLRERGCLGPMRVVLFSAHVNPTEFRRATSEGASGYLIKPFTADGLLESVRLGRS
jgi:CheY-like chemotaxis protein